MAQVHSPTISAANRKDGMSIIEEVKKEAKAKHKKQKEAKAMSKKVIIETIKTIVLTALLSGIIAFTAGVIY